MRHFESRRKAKAWRDKNEPSHEIFKKIKGHKNRVKKPFLVGTYLQWLNQY